MLREWEAPFRNRRKPPINKRLTVNESKHTFRPSKSVWMGFLLMSILNDNSSLPSGMNNKDYIIMTTAVNSRFNEEQLWIGLFMWMNII